MGACRDARKRNDTAAGCCGSAASTARDLQEKSAKKRFSERATETALGPYPRKRLKRMEFTQNLLYANRSIHKPRAWNCEGFLQNIVSCAEHSTSVTRRDPARSQPALSFVWHRKRGRRGMVSVHVAFFLTSAVLFSKAVAAITTKIAGSTCGDASKVTIGPGHTRRCCSSGNTYPRGVEGFDYWVRSKYKDVRQQDGQEALQPRNRTRGGVSHRGNPPAAP